MSGMNKLLFPLSGILISMPKWMISFSGVNYFSLDGNACAVHL